MIASILIPTRGRIDGLNKAISSILHFTPADDVEILLRFDDDDWQDKGKVFEAPNVFSIHGPRYDGYKSFHVFCTELARKAKGDWLLCFNDDAIFKAAHGWTQILNATPQSGVIAHPEWHELGKSNYHTQVEQHSPFPIVPRSALEIFPQNTFHCPVDIFCDKFLRQEKGWRPLFIPGMSISHDRKIDATLTRDRF